MTAPIVVTGTDTGIGKTVFAAALAGALGATYWKPVQAGLDEETDRETVARLAGLPPERLPPEAYRLVTPCSPHRAAAIDGVTIDPARLALPDVAAPLVVEGAGGALVPLTPTLLYADQFARWGAPVVLVARTALGTINHSLLSIEALRARGVAMLGVAFVGEAAEDSEATIAALGRVKRLGRLPRLDPLDRDTLARAFAAAFDPRDFAPLTSPVWHPFTQHGLGEPIPEIVAAEGARLHTRDGRVIVDAISSWWVTTHGHRHPRIVAAIAEEAGRLDQVMFAGWTHAPAEDVARALLELLPTPLAHVFFSDSGSTSVEVALKMALGYWANVGRPRHRIVVLEHGYHGDTIGGMSVGARGVFNRAYAPLLFEVETLPFPRAGAEQATLDALAAIARSAEPPAALIVEPLLLGAGGMLIYPAGTLREMREICADAGILFIADEVMTGWGRTGTLLACGQAGIVPDILCLSKGLTGGALPLAVTIATPDIFEAHRSSDRGRMFFHSSSYTANPIACAAARANLAIWRDEPVLDRVAALGRRQAERLAALAAHPGVRDARRIGTVTACALGSGEGGYLADLAPRLLAFFRERDLLLRPLGDTVYVMPPYCIADDDLDRVYAVIADAADAIASGRLRGAGESSQARLDK